MAFMIKDAGYLRPRLDSTVTRLWLKIIDHHVIVFISLRLDRAATFAAPA